MSDTIYIDDEKPPPKPMSEPIVISSDDEDEAPAPAWPLSVFTPEESRALSVVTSAASLAESRPLNIVVPTPKHWKLVRFFMCILASER